MRWLFSRSIVSDHFWAERTAPLCSERHFQWRSPFVLYEMVSGFPSYGHFTASEVYNSFICSHLFISLSFDSSPFFIYFTGSITFSLHMLFALRPWAILGNQKQNKNFFSPTYALGPAPLCDLGRSKVARKLYSFRED